jgi:hypothetical protein
VRFLWAREHNAKDILKEMFPVCGGKCLSRKAVRSWDQIYSQGHSKVLDDARPGRPVEIATEATVQRAEMLIRADRRITIDSVATALGRFHGSVYSVMYDHLEFWKVHMVGAQRTEGSK